MFQLAPSPQLLIWGDAHQLHVLLVLACGIKIKHNAHRSGLTWLPDYFLGETRVVTEHTAMIVSTGVTVNEADVHIASRLLCTPTATQYTILNLLKPGLLSGMSLGQDGGGSLRRSPVRSFPVQT